MIGDPYQEHVTIGVTLTVRQVLALREIAARDRQTPEQYIALMVGNLTHGHAERDQVIRAWARGLTDKEICEETGLDRAQVGDRRRRAGLPAHRRPAKGKTPRERAS